MHSAKTFSASACWSISSPIALTCLASLWLIMDLYIMTLCLTTSHPSLNELETIVYQSHYKLLACQQNSLSLTQRQAWRLSVIVPFNTPAVFENQWRSIGKILSSRCAFGCTSCIHLDAHVYFDIKITDKCPESPKDTSWLPKWKFTVQPNRADALSTWFG